MGKMFSLKPFRIFGITITNRVPPDYYIGSVWRSTCYTIPLFFFIFFIVTLFCYAPLHPLTKKCLGSLNYILSGKYVVPAESSLRDSATLGLIIALPISIWLGIRKYRGISSCVYELPPEYQNNPVLVKCVTEINTKKHMWLPSPEELKAGFVSQEEYDLRVATAEWIKKQGVNFRILSTAELSPEEIAAIAKNASGITPEKSPEKTPPEPEPLSALRQSLSETIVSPNDELR